MELLHPYEELHAVDLSLTPVASTDNEKGSVAFTFKKAALQPAIEKWCEFKNVYEKEMQEALAIEDKQKKQEELNKLAALQEEWKLRSIMGTSTGCHMIVKKEPRQML